MNSDGGVLGIDDELLAVLSGVQGASCLIDGAGAIRSANAAALQLFTSERRDVVSANLWDALESPMRDAVRDAAAEALAGRRPVVLETIIPRSERRCRVQLTPTSLGLVVHAVDVEEQKRAEELARQHEAELHASLTSWGLIVSYVDRDLRYLAIHNAHPDFPPEVYMGKRVYEIADDPGGYALADLKLEVMDTGKRIRREITFPLSDGEHTYLIRGEPVRDELGDITGVKTVSLEVTELREAEAAAATDYMTGAANRRSMDVLVRGEVERTLRYRTASSLIMLDIDDFKVVNDEYGHSVGDEIIKAVVGCLREELRAADTIARWGGEEFLVLLPETDREEATRVAERMRQRIDRHRFADVGHVTISLGVATATVGEPAEALIARADAACYDAKRLGRNRVATERP